MSYVGEPFDYDLLVSYAHADPETNAQLIRRWSRHVVDRLRDLLATSLSVEGKHPERPVEVFFDDRVLVSGQPLSHTLREKAKQSALLLVLMSPLYPKKTWCLHELDEFFEQAAQDGRGQEHCTVLRIQSLDEDAWPERLRDKRGKPVRFHDFVDPRTELPICLTNLRAPQLEEALLEPFIELKGKLSSLRKQFGMLRPHLDVRPRPSGQPSSEPRMTFGQKPTAEPKYCVSYAWNDDKPDGFDREDIVKRLCAEAERRGIRMLRDKEDMRLGDRISVFTRQLAQCDRVFVILSEKYLRSIYCMTELYEIYLNCRSEDDTLRARVRVFTLPDARLSTLFQRFEHARWWQQEHDRVKALLDEHGGDFLSESDYAQFRRMGHFVRHVPDILSLVNDTLRPRSFEELVRYGFDDPPPDKRGG